MATGVLAYQMLARHGASIDRLRRDMLAEPSPDGLVQFLAYDTACFAYAFLLATGNKVSPQDRRIRDDLRDAILEVLARHGIDRRTFRLWPEVEASG